MWGIFPGGTVDAFEVWLELQATDEKGQTISGAGAWARTARGRWMRTRIFTVRDRSMGMEM